MNPTALGVRFFTWWLGDRCFPPCSHCIGLKGQSAKYFRYGAPGRTRTRDPLITNQVLYQLSYKGMVTRIA